MTHAYEADLICQGFIANMDLSNYQYHAVKMNDNEEIVPACEGEFILGVLQDNPDASEIEKTCRVAVDGITKAIGSAAIDAGAKVQVDTGGKFKTYSSGALAGTAVTACGGNRQQFSLKIVKDA